MSNQHLVTAVPGIAVSVVDFRLLGGVATASNLAESAIILNPGTPQQRIVGIQVHGRESKDGRRRRTNRAIACQIARSIRRREARKAANQK